MAAVVAPRAQGRGGACGRPAACRRLPGEARTLPPSLGRDSVPAQMQGAARADDCRQGVCNTRAVHNNAGAHTQHAQRKPWAPRARQHAAFTPA